MPWCWWTALDAFDTWHDGVCAAHGIPYPGYVAGVDDPQVTHTWTNAQYDPTVYQEGNKQRVVAWVDTADAAGLAVLDEYTVNLDGTVTITIGSQTRTVTLESGGNLHRQPKPPTWTDPNTGKTYDTVTGEEIPVGGRASWLSRM